MKTLITALVLTVASSSFAQTYYGATKAVAYAKANYNTTYNTASNPWPNYGNYDPGGNCTHFVSQCLLSGLSSATTSPKTLWGYRTSFLGDRLGYLNLGYADAWYFNSTGTAYSSYVRQNVVDRGPAWTSANSLYQYAIRNQSNWSGMHFTFITYDTQTTFMAYESVQVGDIIFADWDGADKSAAVIDHSMIVTGKNVSILDRGYNKIRVTYQSSNVLERRLGEINMLQSNGKYPAFYVYRPTYYRATAVK
jgi:Putative amidase domain